VDDEDNALSGLVYDLQGKETLSSGTGT